MEAEGFVAGREEGGPRVRGSGCRQHGGLVDAAVDLSAAIAQVHALRRPSVGPQPPQAFLSVKEAEGGGAGAG